MNAPLVVVFDLGKVLVDFDYHISSRKIAARANRNADEVFHLLCESSLPFRLESGRLTTKEFYAEVRDATGFQGTLEEFIVNFADIFSEVKPMTELQALVRAKGIPTYIFSNTNDIQLRHIRERYGFFANFDGYILSYEAGVMKPNAAIYEIVERQIGKKGGEILYLDDRQENIATAADRGWRVLLHENPEKTRAAVQRILGWPI